MSNPGNNIFSSGDNKLLCYPNHIISYLRNEPAPPITLEIHPSEVCNQHCPHCQSKFILGNKESHARAHNGAFLDVSLLDKIWGAPPKGIILSGNSGDPLCHPDICKIIQVINNRKIPLILITNGYAITNQIAELAVKSCAGIRISLDAYDSQSYSLAHGVNKSHWEQVVRNIQLLVSMRDYCSISSTSCKIGIGYLTNSKTAKGIHKAILFSRKLGVDYIQFRPYHYQNYDISAILNYSKYISETSNKPAIYVSNQKYDRFASSERKYMICHGAYFYTVLDARGDLYCCCHKIGLDSARYDSLKHKNWGDILHDNRRTHILKSYPDEECIPYCRLNSQNELLDKIVQIGENGFLCQLKNNQFPTYLEHSAFL